MPRNERVAAEWMARWGRDHGWSGYHGVSTERRRRHDRESDAGASAALPRAGDERRSDRAADGD